MQRNAAQRQEIEAAIRDAVASRTNGADDIATRRITRKRVLIGFLIVMWATIGWLWIAEPAWLFAPPPGRVATQEEQVASLRFALYLQHARVKAYQARFGRLPTVLSEAGPVEEGVTMSVRGGTFELVGQRSGFELRLSEAMDADSFLGNSIQILQRASSPR